MGGVVLLYTADQVERMELCREWLVQDLYLEAATVMALPVNEVLSTDPIDIQAAITEARRGIELASMALCAADRIELNASSGTPAMKSAWNLLQAAVYVPNARVWQVRDPTQMSVAQARVFESDTSYLRDEFDAKVLARQIADFNYAGALDSLAQSHLETPQLTGLLRFGRFRLAFDFNRAHAALADVDSPLRNELMREITPLRQRRPPVLLRELYFNALVRFATCEYSDFLGRVFRFQEAVMQLVVEERCGLTLLNRNHWQVIDQIDGGKLRKYLDGYRLPGGGRLQLNSDFNRRILEAILEYFNQDILLLHLRVINSYGDLRNRCIVAHGYEGLSEIRGSEHLTQTMGKILLEIGIISGKHPFEVLNSHILRILRM